MNILIFSLEFPPLTGGAGTYSYELSRGLVKNGDTVTVLTCSRESREKEQEIDLKLNAEGITVIRKIWINKIWFLFWHFIFYRFLKKRNDFDLILLTDKNAQVVASKVPVKLLGKYVLTMHGVEIDYYFGKQRLKDRIMFSVNKIKNLFNDASGIIAVSEYLKKQLLDYGLDANKIRMVHHGIDPDDFPELTENNKEALRSQIFSSHGVNGDPKIIISASRLVENKGHDILLKAFRKVIDDGVNAMLLIAGDGDQKVKLELLTAELDLQNKVVFTGNLIRPQLIKYYASSDIFAMVSRRYGETFGIVYIEAMAAGLPVLAAKNGAIDEVIVPGETGLIVDPHSVLECSSALKNLLIDEQLYEKLRQNGKKIVEDQFNNRIMAENTIDKIM